MIKKLLFVFFFTSIATLSQAQKTNMDTAAIMILDKMGAVLGELNSLGFTSKVSKDVIFTGNTFIKVFTESTAKIKGPNKFSVRINGEERNETYNYNGEQVAFYSFVNNIYAIADAPDNLIETFDWLYNSFEIELTSADILYPDFSQQLVNNMDFIEIAGKVQLEGKQAFHIVAGNDDVVIQLWISNDNYFLPVKSVITYLDGEYRHQYETDYSDWELNQIYPDSIFEFMPPPNASQITWLKKD